MSLGPVFLVHGGVPEQRSAHVAHLVEACSPRYPHWTESCDGLNGNIAVVFSTNARDRWAVTIQDVYQYLKYPDGNMDVKPVNLGDRMNRINMSHSTASVMTFGFERYP